MNTCGGGVLIRCHGRVWTRNSARGTRQANKLNVGVTVGPFVLVSAHAPRMREKSPIFVKPKLSISNVIAISDDVTTKRPYCHELVLKGGPKPSSCPFFREGFQIQFSPFGKFRTGRAIFFRPTPKFFADRFTEVGCGGEVVRAAAFGEDGCQERCRAAGTTRTPRASTYYDSTTFGRNPAPLLPF